MKISEAGVKLIKQFEGLKLTSYLCPAGVWTIGYGHTGKDVTGNTCCDEATAEALLIEDLADSEKAVSTLVKVPLEQYEFDALVSFVFNVGRGNFLSSTLLRKLNENQKRLAAKEFPRWNKAAGKECLGLTKRRLAEQKLFSGEV